MKVAVRNKRGICEGGRVASDRGQERGGGKSEPASVHVRGLYNNVLLCSLFWLRFHVYSVFMDDVTAL